MSKAATRIEARVFVLGDNIDTDQIIPAQYLNLVPTIPEEYRRLGSHALCGLPADKYPTPFIRPGSDRTEYAIILAGRNFGCGSSREHAPICLGAAGVKAVVALSYARIFFRNCVATGEVYPVEAASPEMLSAFATGDEAILDIEAKTLASRSGGKVFPLKDLGDVKEVVEAGGIFNYARKKGMIKAVTAG